ncbi:response regulator [Magnetococcus marinus]|nr:response regulator [Magnetococcus marinus]
MITIRLGIHQSIQIWLFTLYCLCVGVAWAEPEVGATTLSNRVEWSPAEQQLLKENQKLTYCIDPNWMPIEAISDEGAPVGITPLIARKLSQLLGIDIHFQSTPDWETCINKLRAGEIDLLLIAGQSAKRRQFLNFSHSYYTFSPVIATLRNTPYLQHIEEIGDRTIGVIRNTATESRLRDNYPSIHLKTFNNLDEGLDAVEKGQLFGFSSVSYAISYSLVKEQRHTLQISGRFDLEQPIHIALSRRHTALTPLFNKAIDYFPMSERAVIFSRWIDAIPQPLVDPIILIRTAAVLAILLIFAIGWNRIRILKAQQAQKQVEHELDLSRVAAQAKNTFFAQVSHEIRGPLNAILGYVVMLRQTELKAQQLHLLEHLGSASHALLTLLNDILDYSRMEAQKLTLAPQPTHLPTLLKRMEESFAPRIAKKGLHFSLSMAKDLPAWANLDPVRMEQVITNLLDNAYKFTLQGHITLEARLESDASTPPRLTIIVSDSGIGMDTSQEQSLFEAFNQADPSIARSYGGSGLGLAICRHILSLMEGDIAMESTPNQGSRFTLRIPYCPVSETEIDTLHTSPAVAQAPKEPRHPLATHHSGCHILLVEDNPLNTHVLQLFFEEAGLVVWHAENGQSALDQLAQHPVDLVMMDVEMPVMDGLSCTRRLRRNYPTLPVIGMTAHSDAGIRQACLEIGMNELIFKPMDWAQLFELLHHWLPTTTSPRPTIPLQPPTPDAASTKKLPALEGIDVTIGLQRVVGRETLYLHLLETFAKDHQQTQSLLRSALLNSDHVGFRSQLHGLKTSADYIGAIPLAHQAETLYQLLGKTWNGSSKIEANTLIGNLEKLLEGLRGWQQAQ